MKTEINLENYDFGKARLVHQISDEPVTGFARVIVVWGAEINSRAEFIKIESEMFHIDATVEKVVKQMTIFPVLNEGKKWIIQNDTEVVKLDSNLNPVPNPDFNDEEEVSDDNFPYLKEPSFDMYARLCFEALTPLLLKGIDNDDNNGCFDE